MKTALTLLLFAALLSAAAQNAPSNVKIEMLAVVLPTADALAVKDSFSDPKQDGMAKVRDLISKKTARVVSALEVTTRSGQRAVAENVRELRYPTEFTPEPPKGAAGEKGAGAKKAPAGELNAEWASEGFSPTTFEVRNTGVTLECEPQVGANGAAIDLNMAASDVTFLGFRWYSFKDEKGKKQGLSQPEFHGNKVSQSMTVKSGQWQTVGSFATATEKNSMELFFLRATAQ